MYSNYESIHHRESSRLAEAFLYMVCSLHSLPNGIHVLATNNGNMKQLQSQILRATGTKVCMKLLPIFPHQAIYYYEVSLPYKSMN